MAEPVLDSPGVVSGVRQCVAAAMAQHVGMQREIEASALAKTRRMPIHRSRMLWMGGEFSSCQAFGRKYPLSYGGYTLRH